MQKNKETAGTSSRSVASLKNLADLGTEKQEDETSEFGSVGTWSFFENEKESGHIDHGIVARTAINGHRRCEFVYLGKKNKSGGVTVVKFSVFEGTLLLEFLTNILDEISIHFEQQKKKTIPFFEDCPSRAFESIDPENRDIFWEHPDMELQSVRARVIFNRIQGNFQLVLNFPVSAEITKKLKGWNGPTLLLTHLGIKHLEAFLIELAAPAYFDSQPNL